MTQQPLAIRPARILSGTVAVPGDKSISHRYALLGALAEGTTAIAHLGPGADVAATIDCVRALGVLVDLIGPDAVRMRGAGLRRLATPTSSLDARNSGTTMRLLSGIVAGEPFRTTIVGDGSLSRRPMRRVIDPLTAMGARIQSDDGRAPLVVDGGRLHGITWRPPVPSAQVKSAVLFAGLTAEGRTTVDEILPTRDHTERAFPAFGLTCETRGRTVSVSGGQVARAPDRPLVVPGDPSSAAVWAAAAAALPGSSVRVTDVSLNPHRTGFLEALVRMGARVLREDRTVTAGEPFGDLTISHDGHRMTTIAPDEVPGLIDELPVLAARAALGGGLEVTGASELRVKESDRITALVAGLRALGVSADERPDGFIVDGHRRPTGGTVDAAGDHRLVMAFAIVALGATGPSVITGADAVGISYPGFAADLARLVA